MLAVAYVDCQHTKNKVPAQMFSIPVMSCWVVMYPEFIYFLKNGDYELHNILALACYYDWVLLLAYHNHNSTRSSLFWVHVDMRLIALCIVLAHCPSWYTYNYYALKVMQWPDIV